MLPPIIFHIIAVANATYCSDYPHSDGHDGFGHGDDDEEEEEDQDDGQQQQIPS